jgi:nucleotidyltransferase/DNA polymerase involved in DNA repair
LKEPQQETPAEKNPWVGWARLGLCKSASRKTPNIVHVDVDAFFASVEQVLHPSLRGKPVLVGCGCVASASYEAKFCGVRTAMSFREALRICPKRSWCLFPDAYDRYGSLIFARRAMRVTGRVEHHGQVNGEKLEALRK